MLQIENVTGGYRTNIVNRDISFQVKRGEIVGLIGLNGARKSTLIKQILSILKPINGSILLEDISLKNNPQYFRSNIAYIPKVPQFDQERTLWEHLEFTASAYKIHKKFETKAIDLLERFQMSKKVYEYPQTFSKGMQQKMMILCSFLAEPSFLIIDEPFVGLDPLSIQTLN